MSDGRWEAEERQRLDDKYLYMCQVAEDSARELMERDKMYASALKREKDLKAKTHRLEDYIAEICDIIYYQEPLRIQDRWLKVMTEKGLYTPDVEDE